MRSKPLPRGTERRRRDSIPELEVVEVAQGLRWLVVLPAVRNGVNQVSKLLSLGWALLLVGATPALGQEEPTIVTVTLTVFDEVTNRPLEGAVALLVGSAQRFASDSEGQIVFSDIRTGTYDLTISHPGYEEVKGQITVDRDGMLGIGLRPASNVWVHGVVRAAETGHSLSAARVHLIGVGTRITDSQGRFSIEDVPRGRYAIEVDYLGRETLADTLVLGDAEAVDVEIRLAADAIPLEGIEVVVQRRSLGLERAGFYDRRDRWQVHGSRLTREDIEENPHPRMADHLINIPGTRIERSGFTATMIISRYGGCGPVTYVDGVPQRSDYDLNSLPPDVIEGVEIYIGLSVPAGFQSNGCGVVLFWTRGYR